jgi:hypothetical protein
MKMSVIIIIKRKQKMFSRMTIKLAFKDEVRRIAIPEGFSYEQLTAKIQSLYPHLTSFKLSWIDDENEKIVVNSTEEFLDAQRMWSGETYMRFEVLDAANSLPLASVITATMGCTEKDGGCFKIEEESSPTELDDIKQSIAGLKSRLNWRSTEALIPLVRVNGGGNFFNFSSLQPEEFRLPENFPSDAKWVKIHFFLRCGNELDTGFTVKMWTDPSQTVWKSGWRYPQGAIAFDSDNIWFRITGSRTLFVQADHIQPTNCHGIFFSIAGYAF